MKMIGFVNKPPRKVRACRVCGCTENDCSQCIALTGAPCWWVGPDLCSACLDIKTKAHKKAKPGDRRHV